MTYLERYQNRVNADGKSVGESLKNNTLNFIDKKFKDAPTYRLAKVYKNNDFTNYSEIDTRVLEINRMGSLRTILLRPSKNLDIGNTLFFDGNYWLVYDKYGSVEDNVKLTVSKINSNLKWIDANDKVCTVPCVSSSSYLGSKSRVNSNNIDYNMFDVRLPTGQIMVFAEINKETKKIDLNHRFIFGRRVYEVTGIDDVSMVDDNYYGVLQFTLEMTIIQSDNDNFETGIAYNEYKIEEKEQTEIIPETGGDDSWVW